MAGGAGPSRLDELDDWVTDHLLNPASATFREGNVLLAEEDRVTDTSLYFAVLGAVSSGRTRRGEIAAAIGRSQGALAHPISVLVEAGLVAPLDDALRQKRTTYHVAEPMLRLHQLVIAPQESRLMRHRGAAVWAEVSGTVMSRIYGPHFEQLARTWCAEHASEATLGGRASRVAPTAVDCPRHRTAHEVDVVVLEGGFGGPERIVAIGEAKWSGAAQPDAGVLKRLEHIRELLGLDTTVKLLVFSGAGFDSDISRSPPARGDVELIDVARLYAGD